MNYRVVIAGVDAPVLVTNVIQMAMNDGIWLDFITAESQIKTRVKAVDVKYVEEVGDDAIGGGGE